MNDLENLQYICYAELLEEYIVELTMKYRGKKFKTNKKYEQSYYYKNSSEGHIFGELLDIEYKAFNTELIYVIEYTNSRTGRLDTKDIYAGYMDLDE